MSLATRIAFSRGVFGWRIAWAVFLLGTLCGSASAQTTAPENEFIGSQVCQACHPDVWLGFNRNPHFKSIASGREAPENTGCEGCHGPGELHVKGMGDKTKIRLFPELAPNQVLDQCLRCHSKDFGKMHIRRSSHSTGEVSCISCHSIHKSPESRHLLADKERLIAEKDARIRKLERRLATEVDGNSVVAIVLQRGATQIADRLRGSQTLKSLPGMRRFKKTSLFDAIKRKLS